MRARTQEVINLAVSVTNDWLEYCRRRSHNKIPNGYMCSQCTYDAVAEAVEKAIQRERRRKSGHSKR